eukprot:CAMPEP_0119368282 /NCGR_PEP_ID=MMETSP1334-20130426/14960_1 /TAXON_ID=127549 /ORGANISM="Calcidiscus leptoporus, Strain RCC1130" /LENGTH=243 /DNA_ID=CAMNT_0007384891 /DNA_START=175 /DNA_END=906 /DNA_ORIENTATION=-
MVLRRVLAEGWYTLRSLPGVARACEVRVFKGGRLGAARLEWKLRGAQENPNAERRGEGPRRLEELEVVRWLRIGGDVGPEARRALAPVTHRRIEVHHVVIHGQTAADTELSKVLEHAVVAVIAVNEAKVKALVSRQVVRLPQLPMQAVVVEQLGRRTGDPSEADVDQEPVERLVRRCEAAEVARNEGGGPARRYAQLEVRGDGVRGEGDERTCKLRRLLSQAASRPSSLGQHASERARAVEPR